MKSNHTVKIKAQPDPHTLNAHNEFLLSTAIRTLMYRAAWLKFTIYPTKTFSKYFGKSFLLAITYESMGMTVFSKDD